MKTSNKRKIAGGLALGASALVLRRKGRRVYTAAKLAKEQAKKSAKQEALLKEARKRLAARTHRKGGAVATYNRNATAVSTKKGTLAPAYGNEERQFYKAGKGKKS